LQEAYAGFSRTPYHLVAPTKRFAVNVVCVSDIEVQPGNFNLFLTGGTGNSPTCTASINYDALFACWATKANLRHQDTLWLRRSHSNFQLLLSSVANSSHHLARHEPAERGQEFSLIVHQLFAAPFPLLLRVTFALEMHPLLKRFSRGTEPLDDSIPARYMLVVKEIVNPQAPQG
jgi:hypothetical protein